MTFNDSLKEFTTRRAALMQAGEELRRFLEESGMPDKARELPPKPYFCWAFLPSLGQVVTDLDSFRDELTIILACRSGIPSKKLKNRAGLLGVNLSVPDQNRVTAPRVTVP